jgi:hypothetical protein
VLEVFYATTNRLSPAPPPISVPDCNQPSRTNSEQ